MLRKEISVVVPCFNEGKTIYKNIKKIQDYLGSRFSEFEIIAVNDGSLDNTLAELERGQKEGPIRIINNPSNAGKGKAVKDGVTASQKEIVMFLDADLGIPIEQLDSFLEKIDQGADMAIASRFVPGMKVLVPVLWYRRMMEKIFRILRMIIINNYSIQDTQCGFKVFRREVAQNVFPRLTVNRFAFDAEVIYIALQKGYKITEVPVILENPAQSSVRLIFDPLNMISDLLRMRWNAFRGRYK